MSDKLQLIDHTTFVKMQNGKNGRKSISTAVPKIRNSMYKRINAINDFNLMLFVKAKQRGQIMERNRKIRKRVVGTQIVVIKNKGKKKENGVEKKPTRLKKSILQYRQKKREHEQNEEQLNLEHDFKQFAVHAGRSEERIVPGLHSSTFREYCNCCKTPDLRKYCEQLVRELNNFQRRAYAQNETKAKGHKRIVVGFRQVQAYLRINKIKLVIIATDCEHSEGGNGNVGLDETIENIKQICNDQKIPAVFAFRRREMAYIIYKKASISCIGILDYDGAREIFSQLIEAFKNAREMYESLSNNLDK